MTDILADLKDLEKQAATERSHYYVAACTRRAVQEIMWLRSVLVSISLLTDVNADEAPTIAKRGLDRGQQR